MGNIVKYTGHNVTFNVFKELTGVDYIRLRLRNYLAGEEATFDFNLDQLNFIVTHKDSVRYTDYIYKVRFTKFWRDSILNFLQGNQLAETRPDGKLWIEESLGETMGHYAYHYYPISDFEKLFEGALLQGAIEMENSNKKNYLVMFNMDEIHTFKDDSSYIYSLMNLSEILTWERNEAERKKRMEENDDYDLMNRKGFYDANSWMDNDDDYLNIE